MRLEKILKKYKLLKTKKYIVNSKNPVDKGLKKKIDFRKHGFNFSESFMYELDKNDYRDYISTWEAYKPRTIEDRYFLISDDKYLFSIVFGKFIEVPKIFGLINNGKVVGIDENGLNNSNLYDFIIKENGLVIKDRFGKSGIGVYVFDIKDNKIFYKNKALNKEDLSKIVNEFKAGLIQSTIKQGKFENNIFDKSTNTIRVISLRRKDGERHEVVAALHRFGSNRSKPVDNYDQGGFSSLIDINTGELGKIISKYDFVETGKKVFLSNHPDTGAKVEGEVIPNWKDLIKIVEDITEKIPFYENIAWDFVQKDDGFALIEINMKSSLAVFQIHHGMRNELLGQKYREHGWLDDN